MENFKASAGSSDILICARKSLGKQNETSESQTWQHFTMESEELQECDQECFHHIYKNTHQTTLYQAPLRFS